MQRILIANRGEIAVRVIRACADAGLISIAVYADQDAEALHVRLADEAVPLESRASVEAYLHIEKIVAAAVQAGADAVHPGYGFLSESADFARAVEAAGMVWIGPSPVSIEALGNKVSARRIADAAGAPMVRGTEDPVETAGVALEFAMEYGLPVVIKAAHGGGGRGMRVVHREEDVVEQYKAAVREATQAFGRGECFVEQYLESPRHIEVQIIADAHGEVIALGTRDCSLQRRHQKLVEEAPAPFITDKQRAELESSAENICRIAGYRGAGTVEFLLAADGRISFLEVNTRLQVEHPVTEETADVDLVDLQFRVARGEHLDPTLRSRRTRGHAIEFRINAEDVGRGFLPSPGNIESAVFPAGPGVRVDSGVASGSSVPGSFDSLLAKIIVWGEDRETAIRRSRRALAELRVEGVPTVLPFHLAVLDEPAFASSEEFSVHTRWIETEFSDRFPAKPVPDIPEEPQLTRSWIEVDGRRVRIGWPAGLGLFPGGSDQRYRRDDASISADDSSDTEGDVLAPVAGTLARWLVDDRASVESGSPVAVIESMKMETQVLAIVSGSLRHIVEEGSQIVPRELLARTE